MYIIKVSLSVGKHREWSDRAKVEAELSVPQSLKGMSALMRVTADALLETIRERSPLNGGVVADLEVGAFAANEEYRYNGRGDNASVTVTFGAITQALVREVVDAQALAAVYMFSEYYEEEMRMRAEAEADAEDNLREEE